MVEIPSLVFMLVYIATALVVKILETSVKG